CGPDCWSVAAGCWNTRGAALGIIWLNPGIVPNGCGWIGCWASTESSGTRRRGAANSSAAWKQDGGRKATPGSGKDCGGDGVGAASHSKGACWNACTANSERLIPGRCGGKAN